MKALISAIIFLCLIFLTGCANTTIGQQYDFFEPNTVANSDIGYLKIHTFSYKEKGDYADDPVRKVYKGYTIYTLNGDHVMDANKAYGKPELIKLKDGEYIVIAEIHKNILNSFSVKIEKGKILEIDKSMFENSLAFRE